MRYVMSHGRGLSSKAVLPNKIYDYFKRYARGGGGVMILDYFRDASKIYYQGSKGMRQ